MLCLKRGFVNTLYVLLPVHVLELLLLLVGVKTTSARKGPAIHRESLLSRQHAIPWSLEVKIASILSRGDANRSIGCWRDYHVDDGQ